MHQPRVNLQHRRWFCGLGTLTAFVCRRMKRVFRELSVYPHSRTQPCGSPPPFRCSSAHRALHCCTASPASDALPYIPAMHPCHAPMLLLLTAPSTPPSPPSPISGHACARSAALSRTRRHLHRSPGLASSRHTAHERPHHATTPAAPSTQHLPQRVSAPATCRRRPPPMHVADVWKALREADHLGQRARASGFVPSVDCSISLLIDPRRSDQVPPPPPLPCACSNRPGTARAPPREGHTVRAALGTAA